MLHPSWGQTALFMAVAGATVIAVQDFDKSIDGFDGRVPTALEAGMAAHIVGVSDGFRDSVSMYYKPSQANDELGLVSARKQAVEDDLVAATVIDDNLDLITQTAYQDAITGAYTPADLASMKRSLEDTRFALDTTAREIRSAIFEGMSYESKEKTEEALSYVFSYAVSEAGYSAMKAPREDMIEEFDMMDLDPCAGRGGYAGSNIGFSEEWVREAITSPINVLSRSSALPDAEPVSTEISDVRAARDVLVSGSTRGPVCADGMTP